MGQHPIRGWDFKMPYATETGLSSARVGRSLAHARLITPILELETCSSSFPRKLSDSPPPTKAKKTKCEQVYVKMDCVSAIFVFPMIIGIILPDYSSCVVSNALLIFETSIA